MARPQYLEDTCKSALNRVPAESRVPFRWTINPYRGCTHSCHYCFARAFHTYLDLGIGDDFSSKIVVKTNVVDVLRRELASPRWDGEAIAMGTATDPYQHCEGRYRLTRGVVETLAHFANPLSMLTKSTMIVRDLDVYLRLNKVASVSEILGRFSEAGIRTGVLVAPILPGLTDTEEHLDTVLAACAEAGVDYAVPIVLHVRSSIREHFMPWVKRTYPWLYPRYAELYGSRSYAPKAYQQEVSDRFARLRLRHGIGGGGGTARREVPKRQEQLALAV
jgi:DNA repair photolyase